VGLKGWISLLWNKNTQIKQSQVEFLQRQKADSFFREQGIKNDLPRAWARIAHVWHSDSPKVSRGRPTGWHPTGHFSSVGENPDLALPSGVEESDPVQDVRQARDSLPITAKTMRDLRADCFHSRSRHEQVNFSSAISGISAGFFSSVSAWVQVHFTRTQ
jgi:hypothetical protein